MKQTVAPASTPSKTTSQPFFGRQGSAARESEAAEPAFFGPVPFVQAKLTIGAPDDPYEREADRVADQVVQRMSSGNNDSAGTADERMRKDKMIQEKPLSIQRIPLSVQRKCAACEEEEKVQKKEEPEGMEDKIQRKPIFESAGEDESLAGLNAAGSAIQRKCAECEKEEAVQRKPSGSGEMTASTDVASRLSASRGGGSPLPDSVQISMGGALGTDLSGVRVHTDSQSVQLNRDLGAQAFTHGSDVYFGAGKFKPGTGDGDRLLAHELAHVGQQGGNRHLLQRFVACGPAPNCPPRAAGESTRAKSSAHQVSIYPSTTFAILVSNFGVNEHRVKPGLTGDLTWAIFLRTVAAMPNDEWEITGFGDCHGTGALNNSLSLQRATDIAALFPSTVRVKTVKATSPSDCIAPNLTETDRSKNRSVLISRLSGSSGPTPPPPGTPSGPVRPAGAPAGFCNPYPAGKLGSVQIAAARSFLNKVWLPATQLNFGTEVHDLWRDYLGRTKGSSLAPRVFRGSTNKVVDAFAKDPETLAHKSALFKEIILALIRAPEANVPFPGTSYSAPSIPLGILLPASSLKRTINYGNPGTQIPGNIAGGTGSSDAGPDLRLFTGSVQLVRKKTGKSGEIKIAKIKLNLQVIDAVDFCPGAAGGSFAQQFTIPMSRLEATPTTLTYDLPFHVFIDLDGFITVP